MWYNTNLDIDLYEDADKVDTIIAHLSELVELIKDFAKRNNVKVNQSIKLENGPWVDATAKDFQKEADNERG